MMLQLAGSVGVPPPSGMTSSKPQWQCQLQDFQRGHLDGEQAAGSGTDARLMNRSCSHRIVSSQPTAQVVCVTQKCSSSAQRRTQLSSSLLPASARADSILGQGKPGTTTNTHRLPSLFSSGHAGRARSAGLATDPVTRDQRHPYSKTSTCERGSSAEESLVPASSHSLHANITMPHLRWRRHVMFASTPPGVITDEEWTRWRWLQ